MRGYIETFSSEIQNFNAYLLAIQILFFFVFGTATFRQNKVL